MADPARDPQIRELIWAMFRDAADEDYLVARWSVRAGQYFQFYWSAQQSLEKYFKGILLINSVGVSKFGHDLVELFDEATKVCGELIPSLLCPANYFPQRASMRRSNFEVTSTFLTSVNDCGDPGNRYRHYGHTFYGFDLHHYDELCFRLRRLVVPLDSIDPETTLTYRQVLKEYPNLQPHEEFSFMRKRKDEALDIVSEAVKWRNFSYYEDEALKRRGVNTGIYSVNSELSMALHRGDEGKVALEWILENARFSRGDRGLIKQILVEQFAKEAD